jgi:formylglycine-generating enzyme required for sulfatase activity
MRRSLLALPILLLPLLWMGGGSDTSFRDGMLPVAMNGHTLLISKYEVSVGSWRHCMEDGACADLPEAHSASTSLPMTGVSWLDVQDYLAWTNGRAGGGLRLPTLDEWRIIDRALAQEPQQPLFTDPRLSWAADYSLRKPAVGPVRAQGSFSTTPEGIADLDGNVWEWTSTCYQSGREVASCPAFIAAGEHEAVVSVFVRDAASGGCATGTPPAHLGFRLMAERP